MLNPSDIQAVCQRALALSPAPATEVRLGVQRTALTRLANSEVSQSIDKVETDLSIRVLLGPAGAPTKVGLASTNRLDDAGLKAVIAQAVQAAELQHDNPELLPPLGPQTYQPGQPFDPATADCPPARRTDPLADILGRCRREGFACAGAFSTAASLGAIATSAGLFAFHPRTEANLSLTISRDDVSGWSEQTAGRVDEIDPAALAERAFDIAIRAKSPRPLPPGPYTVVLPAEAVGDLLGFLGYAGLITKAILEGRSFFSKKLGTKVFGQNISIVDDAYHPLAAGVPFDPEGVPRQRVPLIERGVFTHMVHGRETAMLAARMGGTAPGLCATGGIKSPARAGSTETLADKPPVAHGAPSGTQPTGHGLPAPTSHGALPFNLVIQPGDATLEQMIAATERGLLVTHFHYTNIVRPVDLTITGMTRDGLFLIENGKVGLPVNNMRFTESLVHTFNNVAMVGSKLTALAGGGFGNMAAPAMMVRGFNFSSATDF